MVDNGGDSTVRRDRDELRPGLFSFREIYRDNAIGKARLLEENANLVAVRRCRIVELDHIESFICAAFLSLLRCYGKAPRGNPCVGALAH